MLIVIVQKPRQDIFSREKNALKNKKTETKNIGTDYIFEG